MTIDRRTDVGGKITVTILVSLVMLFAGMFMNAAWVTANEGKNKANDVAERMTAMEARFNSFQSDLVEIKDLLRRSIPKGM